MRMPSRYVSLDFSIDTNRINAMQKLSAMNQLETWNENRVIQIEMCDIAQDEASRKNSARFQKSANYTYPITLDSHRHSSEFRKIKNILFPKKSNLTKKEENDVIIVLHAKQTHSILITNEGGSRRQKGGMLGNKDRFLNEISVKVMRDIEAVVLVENKIVERDEKARRIAENTGEALPIWVGKDLISNQEP